MFQARERAMVAAPSWPTASWVQAAPCLLKGERFSFRAAPVSRPGQVQEPARGSVPRLRWIAAVLAVLALLVLRSGGTAG